MGHDKLRKFAENETFGCLVQPSAQEVLADGYEHLRDYPLKGRWQEFFHCTERRPLVLELGCGKGEYTLELARRNPDRNYVGVDIKGARLWRGAKTATGENLGNVGFLRTRIEFITAFFGPGEVDEIWLTFSDPQPKSANKRLSSPLFLERYRSFLRPGGIVRLKTDSLFLHEYTRAVAEANGLSVLACTRDLYGPGDSSFRSEPEIKDVHTFYENIFLQRGVPITYMAFAIDHDGPYVHPREDFDAARWRELDNSRRAFSQHTAEQ